MKKILVVGFILYAQAGFSQTCPDYVDNGQFFKIKDCYESYRKQNEAILNNVLKDLIRKQNAKVKKITGSTTACLTKDISPNSPIQSDIVSKLSNDEWGNFKFRSVDTNLFYSPEDESSLRCHMKVDVIKVNYPEELREKHIKEGIEDKSLPYWQDDTLIARWKIAADSLKSCGIKIDRLEITNVERVGSWKDLPPDLKIDKKMTNNLIDPFRDKDKELNEHTLKVGYIRDWTIKGARDIRGDWDFTSSNTFYTDPEKTFILIKRDELDTPIKSKNTSPKDLLFDPAAHEAFHTLTGLTSLECHVTNAARTKNPMSGFFVDAIGKFTPEQCDQMTTKGVERGFLKCD